MLDVGRDVVLTIFLPEKKCVGKVCFSGTVPYVRLLCLFEV